MKSISPLGKRRKRPLPPSTVFQTLYELSFPEVKYLTANAGDARDTSSIPGSGKSHEVGNGNLLQYSCLENSMDRRAWWATVHGVPKSRTRLSMHAHERALSVY